MKVLELFAGTRSIGKAFERKGDAHEVFSVEWDRRHPDIDLYADISRLEVSEVFTYRYPKLLQVWKVS